MAALRRCIPARRSWCPASPGTTRGDPHRRAPGGIRALRLRGPGGAAIDGAPRPGGPHRRPGLQRGGGCVLLPGRAPPAGLAQPPEAQQDRPDPPAGGGAGRRGGDPGPPVQGLPSGPGGQAGAGAAPGRAQTSGVRAGRPPQPGHGPAQGPVGGGPGRPLPRPRPRWTAWRPSVPATARLPTGIP